MARINFRLVLPAALVLGVAGPGLAAPPVPGDDPFAPKPDLARGAALYKDHCAMCHDNASGRTPPRAAIEQNTRAFVLSVITQGAMRPMAQGLSWPDLNSLAAYLAKRQGGIETTGLEAPLCATKPRPMSISGPLWNGWGVDARNSRFQREPSLSAADVPRLKVKWAFAHAGGSSGQATIAGGRVLMNSSAGSVYSLDAKTGCAYWRFDADAGTRSSIVIGQLPGATGAARYAAYFADELRNVYAVDSETGTLAWKTKVDEQVGARVTGSLALASGKVFVPISSVEEALATNDSYECCKFRGALVALDASSGKVLWKTYTTKTEPKPFKKNVKGTQMYGPAGGAIWSAPTVDENRKLVYVGTGDSYTDVSYDGADAIMAFDTESGAVRWVHQMTPGDAFIIGCSGWRSAANCPRTLGNDADFGASPILVSTTAGKDVLLAGQKSADIYAINPDDGAIIWQRKVGAGGPLGGVEFGPAADGENIYVAISDIFVPGAKPGLSALRIADGQLLWSTRTKLATCSWKNLWCNPALSQAVSALPGVVFAGSMDGHFRAYDSASGKILFDDDTSVAHRTVDGRDVMGGGLDGAGPTIAGGMVYVTSGYQGRSGNHTAGGVLLAYSIDGK